MMNIKIKIFALILLSFIVLIVKFFLMYIQHHVYFYSDNLYRTINYVQASANIIIIVLLIITSILFIIGIRNKYICFKISIAYLILFIVLLFFTSKVNGYFNVYTGYLYSPIIVEKNLESNFILVESHSIDETLFKLYCTKNEILLLDSNSEYILFTYKSVNCESEGYLLEIF